MLQDDSLLVGYHDKDKQLVKVVNVETCDVNFDGSVSDVPYTDIEGLAVCPPQPE